MTERPPRGGPQRIPQPPNSTAGDPAPWSHVPAERRVIREDDLRRAFTGRVGTPSIVEADPAARVRPSAVLAAFYDLAGETTVVLTRRAWSLRAHTGEVSFPGGALDSGESLVDAALREAREEIGLDPTAVDVLGELDHLMTVTSRSFIVPFVAWLPEPPALTPNPAEVDAVLHVPVSELLLDAVYREERWRFEGPPPWAPRDLPVDDIPAERSIFFFELIGDTVWGATAAMLRHLLGLALGLPVAIDHV